MENIGTGLLDIAIGALPVQDKLRKLASELAEETKATILAIQQDIEELRIFENRIRELDPEVIAMLMAHHREQLEAHKRHLHELYVDGMTLARLTIRNGGRL